MDFLSVANGGMKLYGDDLDYMQTGIQTALVGVIKRFVDENNGVLILSGCRFTSTSTPNEYQIGGGWVVISNKIMYFTGEIYTFPLGVIDFATVELEAYTYDYPSPVAFREVNGVSYTPWKRTEARVKTVSVPSITLSLSDNNRLETVMRNVIGGGVIVNANTLMLEQGITLASNTSVKLSKNDKKVNLMANLVIDSTDYTPNGGVKIASLPSGFSPSFETMVFGSNSSRGLALLYLKPNGDVFLEWRDAAGALSAGSTIFLNAQYYTN